MTLSNKILADQFKTEGGFRAAPTDAPTDINTTISGEGSTTRKDRGHRDLGQVIRKGLEMITKSSTSLYQTNGNMAPGEMGAYMIRAEGASLSINLSKPPAVPANQKTRLGNARERQWTIDVLIYHAVNCTVAWPQNVFPQPEVPERTAGTADFYRLTYFERTGQWCLATLAEGMAMADPKDQEDDTTEPPADEEDEDGSDQETEEEYVDEEGNPLSPQAPAPGAGALVAFHNVFVSVSTNAGATWKRYSGLPSNPSSVSFVKGQGFVCVSSGEVYVSSDAISWSKLDLQTKSVDDLPLTNGDFETGDLTGWELLSGDEPRVLDTTSPPQQGGQYYLNRDWRIINPQNFEIKQELQLPSTVSDAMVSADVYVESHASAELRLDGIGATWERGLAVLNPAFTAATDFDRGVGRGYKMFLAPNGETLDWVHTSGSKDGYMGTNGGTGWRYGELRYSSDDRRYYGAARFNFIGINYSEFVYCRSDDVLGIMSHPDYPADISSGGGLHKIDRPSGVISSAAAVILRGGTFAFYFKLYASSGGFWGQSHANYDNIQWTATEPNVALQAVVAKASDEKKNEWHTISVPAQVPAGNGRVDIVLKGEGSPADVYFDNVRLVGISRGEETISAVGPGNDRHLFLTGTEIYSRDGWVADTPFAANFIVESAGGILISDGSNIALSTDGGTSWDERALALKQAIPSGDMFAIVLSDGSTYEYRGTSFSQKGATPTDSFLARDRRRGLWLAVDTSGKVYQSSDLSAFAEVSQQPIAQGPISRGILAMDSGRYVGYFRQGRDLYYQDTGQEWILGESLTSGINKMIEVS